MATIVFVVAEAVAPQLPNTDTPRSEATPPVPSQAPPTTSIAAPEVAPAPLLDHPALRKSSLNEELID